MFYSCTSLIWQNCIRKYLCNTFLFRQFCFSTLFKTFMVLTLVSMLLGCCLSPIHLKTIENHWMVVIFSLERCKTETFFTCFIDVTSKTLTCLAFFFVFTIKRLVFESRSSVNKTVK